MKSEIINTLLVVPLVVVLSAAQVLACSTGGIRLPTSQNSACGFTHAGKPWDNWSGNSARNIGGGRIVQVLQNWDRACGRGEKVLFVDCTLPASILLWEVKYDTGGGIVTQPVVELQPPSGSVVFHKLQTVQILSEIAEKNGLGQELDIVGRFNKIGHKKRDQIDPYCGWKLYYPDSAGAKS